MAILSYPRGSRKRLSPHFLASEFDCPCGVCQETKIDESLVASLEALRCHFGQPLHISSGYRCQSHNTAVGGAKKSLHMQGRAADVWIEAYLHTPRLLAQQAQKSGFPGIGLYEGSQGMYFVHLDTRDRKFYWLGHQEQPVDSFLEKTCQLSLQILQFGARGKDVAAMQTLLGCQPDGCFGPETRQALLHLQRREGLEADGCCGPKTWAVLLGRA